MDYHELIWESLLGADYRARYYGHLAGRLQRREKTLTILVTLLSSGACLALVAKMDWLPVVVPSILTALAALAGAVLASNKFGKRAVLSGDLHKKWDTARREFEVLWASVSDLDKDDALQRWRAIEEKYSEQTELAAIEFPVRARLAKRCQRDVVQARRLLTA
jgi:hypothetical protein